MFLRGEADPRIGPGRSDDRVDVFDRIERKRRKRIKREECIVHSITSVSHPRLITIEPAEDRGHLISEYSSTTYALPENLTPPPSCVLSCAYTAPPRPFGLGEAAANFEPTLSGKIIPVPALIAVI